MKLLEELPAQSSSQHGDIFSGREDSRYILSRMLQYKLTASRVRLEPVGHTAVLHKITLQRNSGTDLLPNDTVYDNPTRRSTCVLSYMRSFNGLERFAQLVFVMLIQHDLGSKALQNRSISWAIKQRDAGIPGSLS